MNKLKKIKITEFIDDIGVTKLTMVIFVLLGLTMIMDNYEFGLAPYTMPQIAEEFNLTSVETGSIASWNLLGIVIGGMAAGLLSDRFGRKKVVMLAAFIYSVLTPLVYFVPDFTWYCIIRFIGGLGLGAALPVCITLMSEYAPTKRRGVLITSTMAFYLFGGVITGTAAIYVIPAYGWRMMYLIGGAAIIVLILLAVFLRESPQWQITHGKIDEAIDTMKALEKSAGRAVTEWTKDDIYVPPPAKKSGVTALFTPEYRKQTIGLWLMYFLSCCVLYSIMSWMPTLLYTVKGLSLKMSYIFSFSQNVAASIACVVTGLMADKLGRKVNIYLGYSLIVLILPLMAFANGLQTLFLTVLAVGFAINYALNTAQPIIAEYYRPEVRNTGVSFASGVGRFGGFVGPLLVGLMVQKGFNFQTITMLCIVPALLGMLVVRFLVTEETRGKTHNYSAEGIKL